MEKVDREGIELNNVNSFSFVGDPGCDGLGVEIMSIFNAACREAKGDFLLIGGDIVPSGVNRFYENVIAMADAAVDKPIFMLAGNHDTLNYDAYFGRKNYFLYSSNLLLAVLDNSKRVFSEETLELLEHALVYERDNIVIAFHIPPPNIYTQNSVNAEEWEKILKIISPVKGKVKYILCGHLHSYFEDNVNGIKLIVTGGGGARLEEVPGIETPYYHFVEFSFDSQGRLRYICNPVSLDLSGSQGSPFNKTFNIAPPVRDALEKAFAGECQAYIRYRLFAEDAAKNHKPGLAKLFMAASDSEFYHARNFYYAMYNIKSSSEAVSESVINEDHEVHTLYKDGVGLAQKHGAGLAAYAFEDARSAEGIHSRLFREAEGMLLSASDIPEKHYYTCTSCGYTITDISKISACPVCGAPLDKIVSTQKYGNKEEV